jgi:MerR family redox-sensitive transcriptional activator SoxR
MRVLTIGELARRCNTRPSAVRYYEKMGLLPKAARVSGQRRYDELALGRLKLVQVARAAGFSIAEVRLFVAGFSADTPPAARWQTLARRKLADIDAQMAELRQMQALLRSGFKCRCLRVEDCARLLSQLRGTSQPP